MRQERDDIAKSKVSTTGVSLANRITGHSATRRAFRAVPVGIEGLVVVAAPVAAYFILRICLINQDRYVDPWFYTGYGREFKLLLQIHGWNYFAARFPVILLELITSKNLDPILGYAFLRYFLVLLCGVPLYLWARRCFGLPHAIAAYLFLLCNPLFPRLLLWDLTPFVSVPMALAGITCWLLPARHCGVTRGLSGFAFCASIASHAFTGSAIAAFLLVEFTRRLLRREYMKLIVLDMAVPLAGAVLCAAIGLACYYTILGPFDPMPLLTVTLSAIRQGNQYAASNATALNTWIWTNSNVAIPALLLGFVAACAGRELFKESAVSRVWWFSLLYSSGYVIYQFWLHRFVLETFFYFFHLTLVVYLLFPACLYLITRNLPNNRRALPVALATTLLILMPVFKSVFVIEPETFKNFFDHYATASIVAALAAVVAIYRMRWLANAGVATIFAIGLTYAVQVLGLSAPAFAIVYSNPGQAREFDLYRAAVDMLNVFAEYARPGKRVMPWFPASELSISYSLMSATILDGVSRPLEKEGGLPAIGDYERERLRAPDAGYVMILSEDPRLIAEGKRALIEDGFSFRDVTSRMIGGAHFKASLDLIKLTRSPVP